MHEQIKEEILRIKFNRNQEWVTDLYLFFGLILKSTNLSFTLFVVYNVLFYQLESVGHGLCLDLVPD